MTSERLKYPIGWYVVPESMTKDILENWILDIAAFPVKLRNEVQHLNDDQLDTPYRPDGWTIRQVVHHCADSHMNAFIRFKLALTEDKPTIVPYLQDKWAELTDGKSMAVEDSLLLLYGLHSRWVVLLNSMTKVDFERKFIHPGQGREIALNENLGLYAWHGRHHLAHIIELKKRKNWE